MSTGRRNRRTATAFEVMGIISAAGENPHRRNAPHVTGDPVFITTRAVLQLASVLPLLAGMMTTPSTMLRWIFTRNGAVVTCELDTNPAGGYEVCVVPHWNVASAAIERFDAAVTALERHAELARYLRDTGWHLARRGTGRQLRAA